MNPPRSRSHEDEDEKDSSKEGFRLARAKRDPVDDYPERPLEEASKGVVNFDPSLEEHQELRVSSSNDYVEQKPPAGYIAPSYA